MTSLIFAGYVIACFAQVVLAKRTGGLNKPDTNFRDYNITITDIHHTYLHPDFFGPTTEIELHGPNEYSLRWDILKTLPKAIKSVVHSFEKNSKDEYIPSITVRETLCEEFRKQVQHRPIYACGRYQEAGFMECPFKKGVYSASHVRCTSADGTIMAPGRVWRLNKTWVTEKNVPLSATLIDFTINRKSAHFT